MPLELLDRGVEVVADLLPLAGQVEERLGLLEHLGEPDGGLHRFAEPGATLLDLFGLVGVAPDIGKRQALLEFIEFALGSLDIKGTSAASPPSWRACRFAGIVLAGRAWPRAFLHRPPAGLNRTIA